MAATNPLNPANKTMSFQSSKKPLRTQRFGPNQARRLSRLAIVGLLAVLGLAARVEALEFEVRLVPALAQKPVTGRLFVFLSQGSGEPRFGPNWFKPEPFFATDVAEFAPGESRKIDDSADGFPGQLSTLPAGRYRLQAVLDHGFYHQHPGKESGNFHSEVLDAQLDPRSPLAVPLTLNQVIPQRPLRETRWMREVVIRSDLLSSFHGREVLDRAMIVLPLSYFDPPERRYPVIFSIPGFSGDHLEGQRYANGPPPAGPGEVEFIRVFLGGNCKWGHHVHADSATNGPRGRVLTEEMIPHIDRTYRTVAEPTARFLSGHSSGGWSSLWLQVTYPDFFGGVWSSSPDPVSFHDYQQVNLYADPPLNMYVDQQGQRRPIARRGNTPLLWYDSFTRMDDVIGRGGQLRSFEAVFSPLGKDGLPRRLWDRRTGRIDPEVAQAWRPYDIRLKLQQNWPELGPKLRGKLHVVMGSLDTFYLEGATALLQQTLAELGSDAAVTILPGHDHGSLLTPEYYRQVRRQMSVAFVASHGQP
jgi:hypothetical protein